MHAINDPGARFIKIHRTLRTQPAIRYLMHSSKQKSGVRKSRVDHLKNGVAMDDQAGPGSRSAFSNILVPESAVNQLRGYKSNQMHWVMDAVSSILLFTC
jgi:hypothetical protein